MTALLTADEAARLVPGERLVIVRAGDPCDHPDKDKLGRLGHFRCLGCRALCTPDTGYRWQRGFIAPQDWVALAGLCPTCDGDGIDGSHDAAAFYAYSGKLTPCDDCRDGRRIVPLYLPIRRNMADNPTPGYEVDMSRVVGRGSIEVVPVVAQHDPEPPAPYLVVLPNNVWLIGKTEPTVIGLDPLPVPARDFGIVIDCVKLAQ